MLFVALILLFSFILVDIYFALMLPLFLPNLTEMTNHILGANLKHAINPRMSFFHRKLWVFINTNNITVDMCIWIQSKIDIRALRVVFS